MKCREQGCTGSMVPRTGKFGQFYGCSNFRRGCLGKATVAEYNKVVSAQGVAVDPTPTVRAYAPRRTYTRSYPAYQVPAKPSVDLDAIIAGIKLSPETRDACGIMARIMSYIASVMGKGQCKYRYCATRSTGGNLTKNMVNGFCIGNCEANEKYYTNQEFQTMFANFGRGLASIVAGVTARQQATMSALATAFQGIASAHTASCMQVAPSLEGVAFKLADGWYSVPATVADRRLANAIKLIRACGKPTRVKIPVEGIANKIRDFGHVDMSIGRFAALDLS
jgi:hypothetical protein